VLLEQSRAVKVPTVADQLTGTKKVQQALGAAGGFERFAESPAAAARMRALTTRLYSLSADSAETLATVAMALARPDDFVLKPMREGGGNNLYRAELHAALARMDAHERAAYILMDRITPPTFDNILVVKGCARRTAVVSELGVYATHLRYVGGVCLRVVVHLNVCPVCSVGPVVHRSEAAGYLLRTKAGDKDDGGVAAGVAVLDCPALF
jgi:glutathione synthase